ncbi:MAG: hypothetical protein R3B06_08230 [Kofleriaceae bacterium]
MNGRHAIALAAVLVIGGGWANRAAADDDADGEPRLYSASSSQTVVSESGTPGTTAGSVRSHQGQFGLAIDLVTGGRFIKTYDNEYCGDRDANGNTTGNATVCLGRVPFAFDLVASYGVTPKIELMLELRLGVERDFGGSAGAQNGPRLRHYSPGVKFFFSDRGLLKFFSTAQVAIDATGYSDAGGTYLGTDYSLRNANGLHLDFHDAYGVFAFFAEEVAFKRWISIGVEAGIGFQGRYP